MQNVQEILTYEIIIHHNILYLQIPVSGLINPQYLLKEDCLYLFLYNYTQAFLIKNLSDDIKKYIIDGKAYIKESLSHENANEHYISLIPY